jgi:membrane-anchored mycosin MYCP
MTRTPHVLATRATAITAAALLAVLGPATAPVFAAQPSSGAPVPGQPGPSAWEPPPVDMAMLQHLPAESPRGTPDFRFQQKQDDTCITSGVGHTILTDRPPAQQMLNIDQAQHFSTGRNVTVAVIDTGVNPHPFLETHDRLVNGGDYILGDGNGLIDCDGHGTIVAGIIAADTRGPQGQNTAFTGVAPDAKILAIKHTSTHYEAQNDQNRSAGDLLTLAEAIRYAADRPDVKVITMSVDECLPITQKSALASESAEELQAAIHYAVQDKDKVVVAAAGNLQSNGTDQNGQQTSLCSNVPQNNAPDPNQVNQLQIPPVYSDDVVSVGSVDPTTGEPSPFSVAGPWVTIAAPGQFITSVDPGRGGTGLSNETVEGGQQISLQGTSFAAPYVAGVIALVRSRYPKLTARQVVYRIEATAQHPSSESGRDPQVGYGIIDPVAALTAAIPGQNGVPANPGRSVPAALPTAQVKDWTPVRVALIGSVGGVALLLVVLFATRSVRRNRVTEDPAIKPR